MLRKTFLICFTAFCVVAAGCSASSSDFESKEHKFKVKMPGTPKTKKQTIAGGIEQTLYIVEEPSGAYFVFHQDNPPIPAGMEAMLFQEMQGALRGQGTVNSTKDLTLEGKHKGIELQMTMNNPPGAEMRNRIYIVNGNKVYQVMVLGKGGFVNTDKANKFLESFQLIP